MPASTTASLPVSQNHKNNNINLETHLAKKLLLLLSEIGRQFDLIGNDQIAESTVSAVLTLTTETDFCARLRLRLYLHFDLLTVGE